MGSSKWIALFAGLLACGLIAAGCGGVDAQASADEFVSDCTELNTGVADEAELTAACEAGAENFKSCLEDNEDLSEDELRAKCAGPANETVATELGVGGGGAGAG